MVGAEHERSPGKRRKDRVRAYCARCKHEHVFVRATVSHWKHLVLSILTCGLWLISWIALSIGLIIRPWRCEHCGWFKPQFRDRREKR